jgi:hypothetical protein
MKGLVIKPIGWSNKWPYDYYCLKCWYSKSNHVTCYGGISCLHLKLYGAGKLTYFFFYFEYIYIHIFKSRTESCMFFYDAPQSTYCYKIYIFLNIIWDKKTFFFWIGNIWIYKLNIRDYINWIYIKLLNCYIVGLRERFLCGLGVVLRTYEFVYVFIFSYTPCFRVVAWSTGDSKQDIYSHRITMHAKKSDKTGALIYIWR